MIRPSSPSPSSGEGDRALFQRVVEGRAFARSAVLKTETAEARRPSTAGSGGPPPLKKGRNR